MQLSDADLIVAAQSGGETSNQARQDLMARFGPLLRYFAGRACMLTGLDISEIEDVVQEAVADLLDPNIARFDPAHPKCSVKSYLRGLVQNAVRNHISFVRESDTKRHDHADPQNTRRDLPASPADIADPHDDFAEAEDSEQTAKTAAAVMVMATPEVMVLIQGVFFRGETPEKVGMAIGVNRTTVIRRLARFYEHVRAHGGRSYYGA
jgi:RNA polymerase sigma factor (sigma-70 family)